MKIGYHIGIYFALLSLFFLYACNSSKNQGADSYCDSLIVIQDKVITQIDSFFQSVRYRHYDTPEYYNKAKKEVEKQMVELKKIGDFNEDNSLHNAVLQIMTTVDTMLEEEGKTMVRLDEQLLKQYDKSKIDQLDSIENIAILKIQKVQQLFDSVQVDFLTKHGFDIEIDSSHYVIKEDIE